MRALHILSWLLLLGLGTATACSDDPAAPRGAVLRLSYEGPPVRVVEVPFCIEADVFLLEGGRLEARVLWGSTAPAVAGVEDSGCVLPLSVGQVAIWAAAEGTTAADTLEFEVVAPVRLEATTNWPAQVVGRTRQLAAVLEDSEGRPIEGLEVVWSSSDPAIATAGRGGVAKAISPGDVVLTAREPQSGLSDSLGFRSAALGEAKWKWAVPEGHFASYGGPALGPEGVLYVLPRIGSNPPFDGVLHALDGRGLDLWSVTLPGVENHPTVAPEGQAIYAVGKAATYAVSRDGQILWAAPHLSETAGVFHAASVSADGATVYAVNGAQVRALDASVGEVLWETLVQPLGDYLVPPTISPDGSRVFVKMTASDIQAFDATTGAAVWALPDPSSGLDTRVFNNGAVCAGGWLFQPLSFSLIQLDPGDGQPLWQTLEGGRGWSEPAVGPDGTLYLNAEGKATALMPGVANWLWQNLGVNPAPAWAAGPALAADGTVYFVAFDGFYAVEAADGSVLWRYPADPGQALWFYGAPLIGPDGTVYSYSADTLFAFWEDSPPEPDSPWPMWRHDARRSGQAHR